MLVRAGVPLALAQLEFHDDAPLMDLDDPSVLIEAGLRPSEVATRMRAVTQRHALRLFDGHPGLMGLRWWSTIEASLVNLTLFDRALPALEVVHVTPLTLTHAAVRQAADLLGLGM
jgi:hypothetical protein